MHSYVKRMLAVLGRFSRAEVKMNEKTMANKVKEWLYNERESYGIEPISDEKAIFHYKLKHLGSELTLDIVNPKSRPDTIVVGAYIPTVLHFKETQGLDDREYMKFLLDFKTTLTNRRPHTEIQLVANRMQSFVVTLPLYEDGLNKNVFFSGITDLVASALIGIWKTQQYFDAS
jgi:hypothetical protein